MRLTALLALVLALAACGVQSRTSLPAPGPDDGVLVVEHASPSGATVYAVAANGSRVRIGALDGMGSRRFVVPAQALAGQTVRFDVQLAARAGAWTSDPLPIDTRSWRLYVEPTLAMSYASPSTR